MERIVLQGDLCRCANGTQPCPLNVSNRKRMVVNGKAIALRTDASTVNLSGFGYCNNLGNPIVMEATMAAQGVLTPMPCVPMLKGVWDRTVERLKIDGQQAVGESSTTMCAYGGSISISLVGERGIKSE